MIDTIKSDFPADMRQASEFPSLGIVEDFAHGAIGRITDYARDNPVGFGLWALGIGFVLGWKLKRS
jgi:hypothetical protein